MKMMKKLGAVLLALTLSLSGVTMVAYAADGSISFTDPETAVGDMVEVKCAVRSGAGDLGEININLSYDSASLRFESGDGVTGGDGTLTYSGNGESASEVSFTMTFQALTEGSAKVSIAEASVTSSYGGTLSMDEGDSTISIGPGDPSKIKDEEKKETEPAAPAAGDMQVVVDGETYSLSDKFTDTDIPSGYTRTSVTLDGQERQMVTNASGAVCLGYLIDSQGTGEFFIYNQEDATFAPYEEIQISDTISIIVLSDASKVKLPDTYQEAKLTLNEKEFPVWQDNEHDGYYILYAMNNTGNTGYYQYDLAEGTYQRVEPSAGETKEKNDGSRMGKMREFVDGHLQMIMIILGIGGILILVLIIVLAVKLRNRNLELDDLYDEYGIDLEDEEPAPKVKEKKPKEKRRKRDNDFDDDDDDDGFTGIGLNKIDLDDDFDDDDFDEDDFDEDDFDDDSSGGFDEDDFDEDDFDEDDLEDEDDIFSDKKLKKYDTRTIRQNAPVNKIAEDSDLDELFEDLTGKKPGHQEKDDAFKVDFVDLD